MIRAIPSNASDNVYRTLLAQSVVHAAMSGFIGFLVGLVNWMTYLHSFQCKFLNLLCILCHRIFIHLILKVK